MKVKVRVYTTVKNVVTTFTVPVRQLYHLKVYSDDPFLFWTTRSDFAWDSEVNLSTLIVPCFCNGSGLQSPLPTLLCLNLKYSKRGYRRLEWGGMSHTIWPTLMNFTPLWCNIRRRFSSFQVAWSFVLFQLNSFYRFSPDEKTTVFLDNKHFCYQSKTCRSGWRLLPQNEIAAVHSRPALPTASREHIC